MADLNLVVRSRQGDREAFSQLYLEYKDSLYRYAWYKIGDPDYAMDAVSDTMLAALEQIGKLKNPKAFSTYLFRIHAASCSHYVKDVIKAKESEDLSEVESGLSANDGDFKALELREALAILNDVEKDIVLLSVSGFNSKEIAKVTGYTSGATRSKLSRALAKMRDFLEGKYENNDFDFIKAKFDEARVEVPDELDKRVQSKLNNVRPVKIQFRQSTAFKAGMSIAACIAVFVMVITTVNVSDIDYRIRSDEATTSASSLEKFDSYDKVEKYIKKEPKKEKKRNGYNSVAKGEPSPELIQYMESADSTSSKPNSESAETYVQEKGVDEADIIKTSGNDIYYINRSFDEKAGVDTRKVNVIETKNGKSSVANTIDFNDTDSIIEDMFVSDEKLVVNCTSFSSPTVNTKGAAYHNATKAIVYDISDKENPTEINSFEQSGAYISSRLVGDVFYIVSSYDISSASTVKDYIPSTCTGNDEADKLNANDIYYAKNGVGTNYIVVTALDVNTCETIGTTKAVLGCGEDVYSNKDYLYVYGYDLNDKEPNTTIAKISLKDGVKFCDYVKIKGTVNNQYSFAEKDNHLCVFTTQMIKGKENNYLYVFDSNLKQIYKSEAFASGESIKAVKYVDNYAYVITYENTDPLFIINLSNVKKPKFMGNVEVDGFSSMLVNVGGDQLLGVGYNTYFDDDNTERTDGLKFVLFDVSDPLEPKVLDERVYRTVSSEAQYNPKALVENKEKGYYAVPVVNDKNTQKGAIVVSVKDGKIVEKENYTSKLKKSSYGGMNTRVTYVGDYYYLLDNELDVSSFKLK